MRFRCSANCSTSKRCARPMAAIRESSSGACSKRGCSARTWSCSAGSTKGYGRRFRRPTRGFRPRFARTSACPRSNSRIGLAAHDFASALGAPEVLITRARREGRSPTVASRFLLRLDAISGRLPRDLRLERITEALDDPGPAQPVGHPGPHRPPSSGPTGSRSPPSTGSRRTHSLFTPRQFSSFGASIRSMPTTPPRGRAARFTRCSSNGSRMISAIRTSCGRVPSAAQGRGDPSDAACLVGAAAARGDRLDCGARARQPGTGRRPLAAEADGEAALAGITVYGRADRIDRLADGSIAIVDYKTGQPPT